MNDYNGAHSKGTLSFSSFQIAGASALVFMMVLMTRGLLFQDLPGRDFALLVLLWLFIRKRTSVAAFPRVVLIPTCIVGLGGWCVAHVLYAIGGTFIPLQVFTYGALLCAGIWWKILVAPSWKRALCIATPAFLLGSLFNIEDYERIKDATIYFMATGRYPEDFGPDVGTALCSTIPIIGFLLLVRIRDGGKPSQVDASDLETQLMRLDELKMQGVLSDDEFASARKRIGSLNGTGKAA